VLPFSTGVSSSGVLPFSTGVYIHVRKLAEQLENGG